MLEAGQAEREHRDEALAAGERLDLVAVLGEERDDVADGLGRVVFERCGLHVAPDTDDGHHGSAQADRTGGRPVWCRHLESRPERSGLGTFIRSWAGSSAPPSTTRVCPVIQDREVARQESAAWAMSSGSPRRRSGRVAATASSAGSQSARAKCGFHETGSEGVDAHARGRGPTARVSVRWMSPALVVL